MPAKVIVDDTSPPGQVKLFEDSRNGHDSVILSAAEDIETTTTYVLPRKPPGALTQALQCAPPEAGVSRCEWANRDGFGLQIHVLVLTMAVLWMLWKARAK